LIVRALSLWTNLTIILYFNINWALYATVAVKFAQDGSLTGEADHPKMEKRLPVEKRSLICFTSRKNYVFSATISCFGWSLPFSSSLYGVNLPETAMVCG
jgi:hypothetical protein